MSSAKATRRSYGTGSLIEHNGAWYRKWRVNDRQVKRRIGPKREPGTGDGLTKSQAETRLRRLREDAHAARPWSRA